MKSIIFRCGYVSLKEGVFVGSSIHAIFVKKKIYKYVIKTSASVGLVSGLVKIRDVEAAGKSAASGASASKMKYKY